jgi:hypothetical protein
MGSESDLFYEFQVHEIQNRYLHMDGNITTTFTWRKLRDCLNKLTEEQLDKQAHIYKSSPSLDGVQELEPVIAFNTIEYLFSALDENGKTVSRILTRDAIDNCDHPENYVLLVDHNPYGEEGDTYYTLQEDGTMIGNHSGKVFKFEDLG